MISNPTPPPFLHSILGLRPPLATSTRTDLAPSFKLLRSLVNTVYGTSGCRGIEPGLWLAQLVRATQRAGELLQAVWTKLGGEGGVIVDDEGEGGRGVMRLQGLLSDLQIFVGSLASVQDPLSTLLLDPAAYARTQATVNSLIRKLAGLVNHYKVHASVTPLDQWPDQDAQDKADDLAALPLLIAKSRPSRDVLKKFEADIARRESSEGSDQTQPEELIDTDLAHDSPPQVNLPAGFGPGAKSRSLSVANSGLSTAKRSEFLRFVYSQNPHLVSSDATLDSAVAVGAAAVASMGTLPRSANFHTLSASEDGSKRGKKSLVQQRISSFATSGDAVPPLPSSLPATVGISRRIVSENTHSTLARKTWTVDMSGLDAIQRRSSGSSTRPPSSLSAAPQVSVTAAPVVWRTPSIRSRSSLDAVELMSDKTESQPGFLNRSLPPSSVVSETSSDEGSKPPSIATFAEQAAALVAARNRRTTSQSSATSSWTKPKDLNINRADSSSYAKTLPTTPEQTSRCLTGSADNFASLAPISPLKSPSHAGVPNRSLKSPSEKHRQLPVKGLAADPPLSNSTNPSEKTRADPPLASTEKAQAPMGAKPERQLSNASSVTSSTNFTMSSAIPSPPSIKTCPLDQVPVSKIESSSTPLSPHRATPSPSQPEQDFELVPDLIEHTSLLDVILTPSPPPVNLLAPSQEIGPTVVDAGEDLSNLPTQSNLPSSIQSATTVVGTHVPLTIEEPSLQDLLQRASMFENWDQIHDAGNQGANFSTSSLTTTIQPNLSEQPAPGLTLSMAKSPVASLSPQMSPKIYTPLSPPSTGGSQYKLNQSVSTKAGSVVSPRPSTISVQPINGSPYYSPPPLSALTIAEPISPTRSLSGQSWATSLMSAPPIPSDLDLNLLTSGYNQKRLRSTSVISGSIPAPTEPLKSGWRILCLDGGGIRGLSMLYILRELMIGVQLRLGLKKVPLPCECFEMICGVGTGGIMAILLGRLRLEIEVALEAYLKIVKNVFGQGKGVLAALLGKSRFSASKLEAAMKEIVEGRMASGFQEASLGEANGRCRTFVMAMKMSDSSKTAGINGRGTLRTLRSYANRQVLADRCTVYQAVRATSAAPLFFKPVQVDTDPLGSLPNDASLNNPSLEAVSEARGLYPNRTIDCLVSIGTGRGNEQGSGSIQRACAEIAESCEHAAKAVEATARDEGWIDGYSRFNVEKVGGGGSVQDDDSHRSEWDQADLVEARTAQYLMTTGRSEFEKRVKGLAESWKRAYEGEEVMKREGGFISQQVRPSTSTVQIGESVRAPGTPIRRSVSIDDPIKPMTSSVHMDSQSKKQFLSRTVGSGAGGALSMSPETEIKLPELNFD